MSAGTAGSSGGLTAEVEMEQARTVSGTAVLGRHLTATVDGPVRGGGDQGESSGFVSSTSIYGGNGGTREGNGSARVVVVAVVMPARVQGRKLSQLQYITDN
jgi:hypothetical protein